MSTHLCFNLLCLAFYYNIYIIFFLKITFEWNFIPFYMFPENNFFLLFLIFLKISTFTACWTIKNLFTFHFSFQTQNFIHKIQSANDYDEVTKLDWILFMIFFFFFSQTPFLWIHIFCIMIKRRHHHWALWDFFFFALLFSAIFLI